MNAGRLTEAVEDRAVVRVLEKKGIEQARVIARPLMDGYALVMATEGVSLEYECQCLFLVDKVLGRLCIGGVQEAALAVSVAVPCTWGETELKALTRRIKQVMEQRRIQDYTVHARALGETSRPVLTVTGSGVAENCGPAESCKGLEEQLGMSVVMAGYAALEATACVISARKELLLGQLSEKYLDGGMRAALETDMRPAIGIAREQGALARVAGEGGIFAALWDLGRSLDCGMVVQIHEIPMLQETIEVCEIADVNPYQMLSTGSILAVTGRPQELLAAYQRAGIPAAEIGRLAKGHDRVLPNGEEIRYLEPFREDEIYKSGILRG